MSIVVLKKKSKRYENIVSGKNNSGFSLNGTLRNIGTVGNTNLAKSVTRTPFIGTEPKGNGGCRSKLFYGNKNQGNCLNSYPKIILNSGSCCTNDPSIIKPSVKNTKGRLNSLLENCAENNIIFKTRKNSDQSEYIKKIKFCNNNNNNNNNNNCNSSVDVIVGNNNCKIRNKNYIGKCTYYK